MVIIIMVIIEVFNAVELHFLKPHKANCSNTAQLALHLINNRNMTGNSAENTVLLCWV